MDPSACLERIREAYGTDDLDELEASFADLHGWIRKGGFVPVCTEPQFSALLVMARTYVQARAIELEPDLHGQINTYKP